MNVLVRKVCSTENKPNDKKTSSILDLIGSKGVAALRAN